MSERFAQRASCDWTQVRTPRSMLAVLVGTAGGAGLMPFMPGTFGTLVAVPLSYSISGEHWLLRGALWLGLFLSGVWAAKVIDETQGSCDNQIVVMDEVVGFGITAWTAQANPATLVAAFVLFRVFDMLKPPPIRQVDRWSKIQASRKEHSHWWGGFGVMADDVLAGFLGLATIVALQRFGILP